MSEELAFLISYLEGLEEDLQKCKQKFTDLQEFSELKADLQLKKFEKLFHSPAHYKPLIEYLEQLRQKKVQQEEDLEQFETWKSDWRNEKELFEYWKIRNKTKTASLKK